MDGLKIGELAKRTEVNIETIRYYERENLLPKPPRTGSGYRAFPPEAIERIKFIKKTQELGFSLREIKELLELRVAPNSTGADIRQRVDEKIGDIEEKIKTLRAMKKELAKLRATCDGTSSIGDCPILKTLNSERD
jgi:MerR family transcriptional regulator, copper efflux regulator